MKALVIIPTYNECENLPQIVPQVLERDPSLHVLVVDDNSPDGTGRWCDQKSEEDPRMHCLHREGKLGLGTAIIAGMKYGIDHGYMYVLNMDAR